MKVIVDTNIPLVANKKAGLHASPQCVITCAQRLRRIQDNEDVLVLDADWEVIREYSRRLSPSGQPGVGDAFLKWVLTNWANPRRCECISITPHADSYVEFPPDEDLADFDRSDRKFAAVAFAHPAHPPILNATDSDWWHYREAFNRHGIAIVFVCPDIEFKE